MSNVYALLCELQGIRQGINKGWATPQALVRVREIAQLASVYATGNTMVEYVEAMFPELKVMEGEP